MTTTAIIVFIISFLILARSGAMLVYSMTYLARLFKLSEYTIAFVLMSFGTSVAELFVGISSAFNDVPKLSLGNIMGANLINITLVIGIIALMKNGLSVDSKISRKNFWIIALLAFLPVFLALDGLISRFDGVLMLVIFAVYLWRVIGERDYFTKLLNNMVVQKDFVGTTMKSLLRFFTATILLIISSGLLVWSGRELAQSFSLDILSFGIIFMAIGTTLPEITFGIRAAMLNHSSMSVGTALGSIAFNSTFIIGIVSIISPITIGKDINLLLVSGSLFVAFVLFNIFLYSKSTISRREALLLIAIYVIFIVGTFLFR